MNLIADGLLMATAMIAGLYCLVLSRRLRRLTESGDGIGSRIAALDHSLAETRGALTETRDGVAELRASARSAAADLRRRTEAAEELASRLGEASERAEGLLQRLYEAGRRVEAHQGEAERSEPADPAAQKGDPESRRKAIVLELDEPGSGSGAKARKAVSGGEPGSAGSGAPAASLKATGSYHDGES